MANEIIATNDQVGRLVGMFRERIESAFRHGQRVRMSAREGTGIPRVVPTEVFTSVPLSDLLMACEPDGSF